VWRHPLLKALVLGYIAWGAWNWFLDRPVNAPDGILAAAEPLQADAPAEPPQKRGRWTLTPRASYRVTARILGLQRYRFDSLAGLIPEDLALGWGPMSDNGVLAAIDISQSDRFYFWRAHSGALAKDAIISHSANTHVIPADALVGKQLSRLRRGQVVALEGELVDAVRDDGAWIHTSLVRTDTGAGACEVMLVRDVSVVH
jgi:hypothetical protein